jgi:hypothetical protein
MEVLERLHQLDLVAAGERRSAAEVARIRRELREMVAIWRTLLERHRADADGYCPRCRTGWRRRQRWPCGVWIAAQNSLIRHRTGWPTMSVDATPQPSPPIVGPHRTGRRFPTVIIR